MKDNIKEIERISRWTAAGDGAAFQESEVCQHYFKTQIHAAQFRR